MPDARTTIFSIKGKHNASIKGPNMRLAPSEIRWFILFLSWLLHPVINTVRMIVNIDMEFGQFTWLSSNPLTKSPKFLYVPVNNLRNTIWSRRISRKNRLTRKLWVSNKSLLIFNYIVNSLPRHSLLSVLYGLFPSSISPLLLLVVIFHGLCFTLIPCHF